MEDNAGKRVVDQTFEVRLNGHVVDTVKEITDLDVTVAIEDYCARRWAHHGVTVEVLER